MSQTEAPFTENFVKFQELNAKLAQMMLVTSDPNLTEEEQAQLLFNIEDNAQFLATEPSLNPNGTLDGAIESFKNSLRNLFVES